MFNDKKKSDKSELEDTKVAEESTPEKEEVLEPEEEVISPNPPGGIESPKEEGAKETEERDDVCEKEVPAHKAVKEDPSVFTERVLLGVELIKSKSLQEVIAILDYQLQAIRNLAIEKITEYKN